MSDSTNDEKRTLALNELICTEKTYVEKLTLLCENVAVPLKVLSQHQKWLFDKILSAKDTSALFGSIQEILNIQRTFECELSRAHWRDESIANVFLEYVYFFRAYKQYMINYRRSSSLRTQLMAGKTRASRRLLSFVSKSHPQLNVQELQSILVMPIQRVARYELLLKEVVKHTNKTHPDYPVLTEALQKIKEVAESIEIELANEENRLKIVNLSSSHPPLNLRRNSISLPHSANQNRFKFASAGRVFLQEGPLKKVCRKKVKEFHFFLFSDVLVWGTIIKGGRFLVNRTIPVDHLFSYQECNRTSETAVGYANDANGDDDDNGDNSNAKADGEDEGGWGQLQVRERSGSVTAALKVALTASMEAEITELESLSQGHSFQIINSYKSFVVSADSGAAKEKWKKAFEECEARFRSSVHYLKRPPEHKLKIPGVWEQDEQNGLCVCKRCSRKLYKFTRHHCRKCGDLVCGACSNHTLLVGCGDQSREARACDSCFRSSLLMSLTASSASSASDQSWSSLSAYSPIPVPATSSTEVLPFSPISSLDADAKGTPRDSHARSSPPRPAPPPPLHTRQPLHVLDNVTLPNCINNNPHPPSKLSHDSSPSLALSASCEPTTSWPASISGPTSRRLSLKAKLNQMRGPPPKPRFTRTASVGQLPQPGLAAKASAFATGNLSPSLSSPLLSSSQVLSVSTSTSLPDSVQVQSSGKENQPHIANNNTATQTNGRTSTTVPEGGQQSQTNVEVVCSVVKSLGQDRSVPKRKTRAANRKKKCLRSSSMPALLGNLKANRPAPKPPTGRTKSGSEAADISLPAELHISPSA